MAGSTEATQLGEIFEIGSVPRILLVRLANIRPTPSLIHPPLVPPNKTIIFIFFGEFRSGSMLKSFGSETSQQEIFEFVSSLPEPAVAVPPPNLPSTSSPVSEVPKPPSTPPSTTSSVSDVTKPTVKDTPKSTAKDTSKPTAKDTPKPQTKELSKENKLKAKLNISLSSEDKEYKKKLLHQISLDRKAFNESRVLFDSKKPSSSASSANSLSVPTTGTSSNSAAKLLVRLVDGSVKEYQFKPSDKFSTVRAEISSLMGAVTNYQIIKPYPARILDDSADESTLAELDLVPSASLCIRMTSARSVVAETTFSFFGYILNFLTALVYRLYAFYLGVPYEQPASLSYQAKRPEPFSPAASSSNTPKPGRSPTPSAPVQNIDSLAADQDTGNLRRRNVSKKSKDGSDSDDMPLYNGNSTNVQ
ncbi:UBX domain-containing protein 4 [Smittium mucronatum]|uniref:UBX domain-containing protein 4 n=1 Tax=Smittium mucronatum TaxID=133383 RepID=A0A1R0GVX0_9FUNG|nr:UBX domain-containing protein 4 [Smittium mucronatum]